MLPHCHLTGKIFPLLFKNLKIRNEKKIYQFTEHGSEICPNLIAFRAI